MNFAVKAVVLDWAGTMVDHGSRAPVIALQRLFAEVGCPITEGEVRRDMGRAKRDHIRGLLAMPRIAQSWADSHGSAPVDTDTDRLMGMLEPIMRAAARDCATLIPGAAELARRLRAENVRIGSCTGYTRTMMADILPLAASQGYSPDTVVCSGETPAGRPSPLMLWQALIELAVWPAWTVVKIDDAPVGIMEGRSAATWTIGLSASGNGVGLSAEELSSMPEAERHHRLEVAADAHRAAGADYVIESVADAWPVLEVIGRRIAAGERPPA